MDKLRVIQWTTGKVGSLSMRGVLDDPRMELVGVYAWSDSKSGTDAGELCGRPDTVTGITATSDIDALIATGADSVLYTPFEADLDQAIRLLEAGMDVVSTNLFLNVGGIVGEVRDKLEAACQKGNSSLYITGISPGWINSMATALTAACRDVQFVGTIESADCSVYESVETWSFLGIGEQPKEDMSELMERARAWLILFRDVTVRIGDALGLTFDDIEFFCDYATAAEDVDLGWFKMDKGTYAALNSGWYGKIDGERRVEMRVIWYLTRKLAEGWEIDEDQHRLIVKGDPDMDVRLRYIPPPHWGNHDWDTMTAMPAVNALFQIKEARAGILGLLDVGLPHAPMGTWLADREG
jgi:hypothetical protein